MASLDGGKRFDEIERSDFFKDYLCWIMCFPAQSVFPWSGKACRLKMHPQQSKNQPSCLHLMFKYHNDLDDGEPSQKNCSHLKKPSPIIASNQVSPGKNVSVGYDIPAWNLRSISIVMIYYWMSLLAQLQQFQLSVIHMDFFLFFRINNVGSVFYGLEKGPQIQSIYSSGMQM